MLIDFKAKWFQTYARAVLEDDREMAQIYIENALAAIAAARIGQLEDTEREAMDTAIRYLTLLKEVEPHKTS